MIIKSILYVESRFDRLSVACPNHPCAVPSGWTADESGCFGLMQIVPACGGSTVMASILANGHPDLEMDPAASDWAGSVFNPATNIDIGVAGIADNRAQVQAMFPGCTEEQYTLMAIGNYNSYGSTQSCTVYNTAYRDLVLAAYDMYVAASGYAAHPYPR
jgi:soluble lytic murein transglycosylase-like protein